MVDIDFGEAVTRLCRERGADLATATISERVAIGEAAEELLRDRIDERKRRLAGRAGRIRQGRRSKAQRPTPLIQLVSSAVGMPARRYRHARRVVRATRDAVPFVRTTAKAAAAHMDRTGQVYTALAAVMAAKKAQTKPLNVRHRRPIADAAREAGWALRRKVERIERIFDDERYLRNKDQVTTHLGSHLTYAADAINKLIADHIEPTRKEATND